MRVLITGAGSGIGRATAEVLARKGHDVVATARDVGNLAGLEVAARLRLDITDEASVAACLSEAGDIEVLVNNAGITLDGPIESYPLQDAHRCFEANVFGPLRMVQAVAPGMRERRAGVIVNVSSVQGRVPTPLNGIYCATKHALEAISESLHYELGHFGVWIVIVQPGYIAPGMKRRETDSESLSNDGGIYDELRRQWSGMDDKVLAGAGRPAPELVGEAIADAIADPTTPLRVPVGTDAEMILATRAAQTDATFEQTMREVLGLTW